jgi:hypothetical protein
MENVVARIHDWWVTPTETGQAEGAVVLLMTIWLIGLGAAIW